MSLTFLHCFLGLRMLLAEGLITLKQAKHTVCDDR